MPDLRRWHKAPPFAVTYQPPPLRFAFLHERAHGRAKAPPLSHPAGGCTDARTDRSSLPMSCSPFTCAHPPVTKPAASPDLSLVSRYMDRQALPGLHTASSTKQDQRASELCPFPARPRRLRVWGDALARTGGREPDRCLVHLQDALPQTRGVVSAASRPLRQVASGPSPTEAIAPTRPPKSRLGETASTLVGWLNTQGPAQWFVRRGRASARYASARTSASCRRHSGLALLAEICDRSLSPAPDLPHRDALFRRSRPPAPRLLDGRCAARSLQPASTPAAAAATTLVCAGEPEGSC
ncbi:uncharacterized protein B0H18DRAFT_394252 [Fomitopsis serialis]|uniref:uncharacterized protein n=1 Tax=Fomitopsis serialis TaxID=139415 RepID=UPI00200782D8|nr:uncharacterized protein B0H18DRAFT_394252 [Neoantrodia serialis]KAH9924877.1 hypothetical protein B0H18DRAFT_394252 [Neoantrodia serialis]